MTLTQHNTTWKVQRRPNQLVIPLGQSYGELGQYDPNCAACRLGHPHTWAEHDDFLEKQRRPLVVTRPGRA